jgi:nucleoid-associated protein YgaU
MQRRGKFVDGAAKTLLATVLLVEFLVSGCARRKETYVLQPGDTLSKIADRFYHDPARWRLIYDANREVLVAPDDVTAGETIVIPTIEQ